MDAISTKIEIIPARAIDPEIWPENGFATLPGELIYYDAVEKNDDGKIIALKRCNRAIEGVAKEHTVGTPIYGMVVAQHHNQLVQAIIEIEKTIGDLANTLNKTPAPPKNFGVKPVIDLGFTASLHTAMTSLLGAQAVTDDICPDIQFEFNMGLPIAGGTTAEYCLRIYPYNPATTTFTIDFGDGSQTTTELQGTHTFAPGGPYTPSAQIQAPNCTMAVQPSTPDDGCDITPSVTNVAVPFHIAIPDVPDFPTFVNTKKTCPGQLFNLPPIMVPYMTLCSQSSMTPVSDTDICSIMVSIVGCCLPSEISIVGCCPPSIISFEGCCPPSIISFIGCCPPSVISFEGCCPPSIISFEGCCPPSIISFIGCCPPSIISFEGYRQPSVISFEGCCQPSVISFEGCCPPSVISLEGFCLPSVISMECCNLPSVISMECCNLPSVISFDLPSSISLDCCTLPSIISMSCCDIPSVISFGLSNLPSVISITCCNLPSVISVDCCNLPSTISVTFGDVPSFAPVCWCPPPSFASICFCPVPSFAAISFDCCNLPSTISVTAPNFAPISVIFGTVPSFAPVCWCPPPSFASICFCPPPSFDPITFSTPPSVTVNWGIPPTVSCVVTVACPVIPSSSMGMAGPMGMAGMNDFQEPEIPVNINDIGIPEEIRIVAPKIPDIKLLHDIPREIFLRMPVPMPDIKIIGPDKPLPETIHVVATDIPKSIYLDAVDVPRKILVEPAANFPSIIRMEAFGIPDTLQVTGIPKSIEVIGNIPSTIQLVMPENPTIELIYKGAPLEMGLHPTLEKLLSHVMMVQPGG